MKADRQAFRESWALFRRAWPITVGASLAAYALGSLGSGSLRGMLFGFVLQFTVASYFQAAIFLKMDSLFRGERIPDGDLLGRVAPIFRDFFWTSVKTGVPIGLGLVFFILPGAYLLSHWAFALPLVVMRDTPSALDPVSRSEALTAGQRLEIGKALGMLLLLYLGIVLAVWGGGPLGGTFGALIGIGARALALGLGSAYLILACRRQLAKTPV